MPMGAQMKILRSKGSSYTRFETRRGNDRKQPEGNGQDNGEVAMQLSRGLLLSDGKSSEDAPPSYGLWDGETLPGKLEEDIDLDFRNYIQWLDKALRKPRDLNRFDLSSYIARTHLSELLWEIYLENHDPMDENNDGATKYLKEKWRAKVHPYVKHDVDWKDPSSDRNAEILKKQNNCAKSAQKAFSETRWTATFNVPIGEVRRDAFVESANNIVAHMRLQEIKLNGDPRTRRRKKTGYGLVQDRGYVISTSTADPRNRENHEKYRKWNDETEITYRGKEDVAENVYLSLVSSNNRRSPKQTVGESLYLHLGKLGLTHDEKSPIGQEMWNLHNATRLYYRRIVESRGFLEALRIGDTVKLQQLLPQDMDQLLRRLRGVRSSSDLMRMIRLGKLIAHSIDLCMTESAENVIRDNAFDDNIRLAMTYYASSAGQSDIKRNEAFVRVLRNSVSFAQRTLQSWVKRNIGNTADRTSNANNDIASQKVAADALNAVELVEIADLGRSIYGTKQYLVHGIDANTGKISTCRNATLFDGTDTDRETLWGLMRISGRIRDRSYHFNTKNRFLKALNGGMLLGYKAETDLPDFVNREGNKISSKALDRIHRLLTFDLQVDASLLAADLNRAHFADHVRGAQLESALKLLARSPGTDDWITPKFMAVMQKANDLANTGEDDQVPEVLRGFKDLKLSGLSHIAQGDHDETVESAEIAAKKRLDTINRDKIGLLRLLYNRAFSNWLEDNETDTSLAKEVFGEILKAKQARRAEYQKSDKRHCSNDDPWADRLLSEATNFRALEFLLQSDALISTENKASESALLDEWEAEATADKVDEDAPTRSRKNPYIQDRQLQRETSNRVQEFRLEVYAFLFARFIKDADLNWIFTIVAPEGEARKAITAADLPIQEREYDSWHRQFYAWLYLVPVDQIAFLRHQFRKTEILERKGAMERAVLHPRNGASEDMQRVLALLDETSKTGQGDENLLRDLDRLMGLYTRVQGAGFDGTEVAIDAKLFADDPLHRSVWDGARDDLAVTLPGTLAGLRQLKRLGTAALLNETFLKHRVTFAEAQALATQRKDPEQAFFAEKHALRADLVKAMDADHRDDVYIRTTAEKYRKAAIQVCKHDFAISAARLTDFADLHHLLMQVLSRLTDFTALWERDRDCLLLAMAFEKRADLVFTRDNQTVKAHSPSLAQGPIVVYTKKEGFRYISAQKGITDLAGCDADPDSPAWRFFGLFAGEQPPARTEHSADVKHREAIKARPARFQGDPKTAPKPNVGHHLKLSQIRNDLAHFNVLDQAPNLQMDGAMKPRSGINLTYLINAVRALLSYDRKLKNAVPKAIADILQREGFAISWTFSRDRLTDAVLRPVLQEHLTFVRAKPSGDVTRAEPLSFALPRVSPRQLSMTRALFDFSSSGYLEKVQGNDKVRRLAYPADQLEELRRNGVPSDVMIERELPSEISKARK